MTALRHAPRRRAPLLAGLAAAWLALAGAADARAAPLVADLSQHLIAITTGFTGTDVLMFGATDGPGDVIVVVRGPENELTVRRKARIAGIWINRDRMTFESVPSFYAVAASKPIDSLIGEAVQKRQQIGLHNLRIEPAEQASPAEAAAFEAALLRNQQRIGLFKGEVGKVTFLGERLFRTNISFPSNVPIGRYLVEVLLIRDGEVVSAQTTPLIVSQIGVGAEIFDYAHMHSAIYGLLAILVALMAGWFAHLAFRRR